MVLATRGDGARRAAGTSTVPAGEQVLPVLVPTVVPHLCGDGRPLRLSRGAPAARTGDSAADYCAPTLLIKPEGHKDLDTIVNVFC